MKQRTALEAMHAARKRIAKLRAEGREDSDELFECIVKLIENNGPMDEVAYYLEHLRVNGNAAMGRKIDHFMLHRITQHEDAKQVMQSALDELKATTEKLLSPPLYPALYLGTVTTDAGQCARLAHQGSCRVVVFGDNVNAEELRVGDEVLLCNQRNLVIAKAPYQVPPSGETATYVRTLADGRLVLNERETEVIVTPRDGLDVEDLRAGDHVLYDRFAHLALSYIERDKDFGYQDIDGSVTPRVGGLDQICESVIARFVFSIVQPELAQQYGVDNDGSKRLLLYGPPGIGKTLMMRMVAAMIAEQTGRQCRVVTVSGAEFHSPYVGVTEQNIRRCFAALSDYDGPGIIFIDELDAIGRARGHTSGYHDDRFLSTLLAELEGMHRRDVSVIATTNQADALDPALRERFSWEVEMTRPNMQAARKIFQIHMAEEVPYRPNSGEAQQTRDSLIDAGVARLFDPNADNAVASLQFRDGKRREVAARELVSGRVIEQICATARAAAFERCCRGGESGVTVDDMREATGEAIGRLRRTLTIRNVRSYLADLPQDLDVVAVDAVRPRVEAAHYAR